MYNKTMLKNIFLISLWILSYCTNAYSQEYHFSEALSQYYKAKLQLLTPESQHLEII